MRRIQITIEKMKLDGAKGKGIRVKGSTGFSDAGYCSVLERVKDELFDAAEREGRVKFHI